MPLQPTVSGESLQGTMSGLNLQGPQQPVATPTQTPNPTPAPQPAPRPTQPQPTVANTQPNAGVLQPTNTSESPFVLQQMMDALKTKVANNNALMTQRNLILKHLYDVPLTPDEMNQLDPAIKPALERNDRNLIDFNLRLINDEIQGRTATLDKSVQYLTQAYQDQITQAEKQKQDAFDNILKYQAATGEDFPTALHELYGPEMVQKLQSMGLNISGPSESSGLSRMDRNNNPTAMTTDVARTAGLVEGVDYVQGDPFTTASGQTLYTAKLLGDPIQTTIKAIDNAGFYTASGQPRWSYLDQLDQNAVQNWSNLTNDQKADLVNQMYKFEGGSGEFGAVSGKDYAQVGLLANTTYDPSDPIDNNAKNYIERYLKNSKYPTAYELGLGRSSNPAVQNKFREIQDRADTLYYEATGTSLPTIADLTGTWKIINQNKGILNKINIASDTVESNFNLAISGEITNNVNKNATIVNKLLNPIYLALGDPAVNQAMVSNGTITQEFANLISTRNAQGTLQADKLLAEELLPFGTSVEAQKAVVTRLVQEAVNIKKALTDQQAELFKQVDPLQQNPNNPSRITSTDDLKSKVNAAGYDYDKMKADNLSDNEIKQALGL